MMKSAIASGHKCVTETAAEILRAGGNAFDAVVAASFTSAVAEPTLTSLGGGGFLLAKPAQAQPVLYDFFVNTPGRGLSNGALEPHFLPVTVHFPGSEQVFQTGHGAAAVPGMLRGILHAHRILGSLPLEEIVAPAVEVARTGLRLNATQAYILKLLGPIMTLTSGARNLYAPNGHLLKEGTQYCNSDLASFLETLSSTGDSVFYEGEIAKRIVEDMRDQGGLLTRQDLGSYQAIERKPLALTYREHQLLTNPLPSFGGSLLAYSLKLLECGMAHSMRFGQVEHLCGLTALMQQVDKSRLQGLVSCEKLTENGGMQALETIRKAFGGTTHISVIDKDGNAASLSSSNGEGSGYIVPGTGIMLNNMMGEDDLHPDGFHSSPPGQRVASMMSPSIVLKDGRVDLVLGSGGSKRIRSALLQVLSNVIDFGMSIGEAIEAPRLHWDGELVQLEPGFSSKSLQVLQDRFPVNPWKMKDVYFGGVHAVSGSYQAAADSRRGGSAMTL